MIDNYTTVVYGWKLTGSDNVNEFTSELEDWNEDYFDITEDVLVEDTMCGEYVYFGAVLVSYDAEEGDEIVIDDELINKYTNKWNNFLKENPKFEEIIKKYKKGEPKLYVFQKIW